MPFENILTQIENGIFTLTVNRPEKLNALNKKTIQEIGDAISEAEKDNQVKIIIITGSGQKAFVAGADISEFAGLSTEQGKELARNGHLVFNSIENCTKPVIVGCKWLCFGRRM